MTLLVLNNLAQIAVPLNVRIHLFMLYTMHTPHVQQIITTQDSEAEAKKIEQGSH